MLFVISAAALGSEASPGWKHKVIDKLATGAFVVDVAVLSPDEVRDLPLLLTDRRGTATRMNLL